MAKASDEVKEKAKSLGIKSWHVKSEDKLLDEIAEIEGTEQKTFETESAEEKTEPVSLPKVDDPIIDPMGLVKLMNGVTYDQAMISLKALAQKSPYFPYKSIIEKELNGD